MVNSIVSYIPVNATSNTCQLTINEHATIHHNKTKIYICSLSRRTSKEEKNLTVTKETIQYNDKGKGKYQCKGFYHKEIDR